MIADYAWGQSFKSSLEDAAKSAPNIRFNIQVAPVPTTNFTPYLRAFGDISLLVATGHPPGSGAILAQAGQLGIKAPVVGAYIASAWLLLVAANLLLAGYLDVAVRDVVMSVAAFTLARLLELRAGAPVRTEVAETRHRTVTA